MLSLSFIELWPKARRDSEIFSAPVRCKILGVVGKNTAPDCQLVLKASRKDETTAIITNDRWVAESPRR